MKVSLGNRIYFVKWRTDELGGQKSGIIDITPYLFEGLIERMRLSVVKEVLVQSVATPTFVIAATRRWVYGRRCKTDNPAYDVA